MIDPISKGQSFDTTANFFNKLRSSSNWVDQRRMDSGASVSPEKFQSGIVWVKNGSGAEKPHKACMAIQGYLFPDIEEDSDHYHRFLVDTPEFNTVSFSTISDAKFAKTSMAILFRPLEDNAVGPAMIFGTTSVFLKVGKEEHTHAMPDKSDDSRMITGFSGHAKIEWKEKGTGEKLGVVSFPLGNPMNWKPQNPYEIDRTNSAHDDREWDPSNNKPEKWRDYDGLKFVLGHNRYTYGIGSESITELKDTFEWLTAFAPIITSTKTTIAHGEC